MGEGRGREGGREGKRQCERGKGVGRERDKKKHRKASVVHPQGRQMAVRGSVSCILCRTASTSARMLLAPVRGSVVPVIC